MCFRQWCSFLTNVLIEGVLSLLTLWYPCTVSRSITNVECVQRDSSTYCIHRSNRFCSHHPKGVEGLKEILGVLSSNRTHTPPSASLWEKAERDSTVHIHRYLPPPCPSPSPASTALLLLRLPLPPLDLLLHPLLAPLLGLEIISQALNCACAWNEDDP